MAFPCFQAKPLLEAGKISQLIDPKLGNEYDENQIKRIVQIASHCIRQPSIWRPSMSEVNFTTSGKNLKISPNTCIQTYQCSINLGMYQSWPNLELY
jgi:hypothetical protein